MRYSNYSILIFDKIILDKNVDVRSTRNSKSSDVLDPENVEIDVVAYQGE